MWRLLGVYRLPPSRERLLSLIRGQFVFFLLVLWQVLCWARVFPPVIVPSPINVAKGLIELVRVGLPPGLTLGWHLLASLYRVAWGFFVAIIIGFPLGILMGWFVGLRQALRPVIEVIRPIPPLAWIPIAIIWLGIGTKSAAFIIFLGAFFPILLNTISGVVLIDPSLIDAARSLRVSSWGIFIHVAAMGGLPATFTGMRVGLGVAWMALVAAEFTGVKNGYGLGYMIMTARDIQRPDEIIAGMAVIGMIGYGMDVFIRFCRTKVLKWSGEE